MLPLLLYCANAGQIVTSVAKPLGLMVRGVVFLKNRLIIANISIRQTIRNPAMKKPEGKRIFGPLRVVIW
jgi:hypothetical protein